MVAGVVTVGRHKYAVGLYWENSPGSGRVAQIAKEAASQPGQQADFYAVRPGNRNGRIPQFGLSNAEAGQKAGMPVMAGCLASQIPGSWAGAFRLNEGIILIIVRDDLIVPDGDLYFIDEAEARDRLIQEVGFGGLQSVYAPESWSIPSADSIPLTLLLNDRRDIKLQQVRIPQNIKIVVVAVALLFIFGVGGGLYWQEKQAQEEAERQRIQEAIDKAKHPASTIKPIILQTDAAPKPEYDRKWEKAPSPMAVVEACRKGLGQIPATIAGWRMGALKCTGTTITLSWARERGFSASPPELAINDTGSGATQTVSLPDLQPRSPETLMDTGDITKIYLAQNWPGSVARATDDPIPPPAGYTGPWNPPPAPWVKRSFTLTVSELPAQLPELIGNLPGVILNGLSYTPGGTWTVEGVIYENRK